MSALFLWQCDHEGPTVGAPEFGSVVVAVSVPGGPEGKAGVPKAVVAKGLVRLSGIQIKKDIQQELPVQAGRMQGRIDGVPVGQVQVDLSLLDVGEVVLWQASTRVVVAPNATATASLTCKPVGDKPPDAAYSVKPETGKTSTEYEFGAQVSDLHDPTDALEVRWDFESDGRFDTDWSTTKIVRHTYAKPGTYRVALEARDAGGKIGTNSDHTVQVQNSPPVANAGQDITRNAGQTVQLDGKASADPDGTALTYSWRQTAGPTVIIQGEGTATPTFVATEGGTYSFALRVRDGELDSPEDEVLVTVIPASVDNRPPVADAGPDRTVDVGTTVQLDGTGSTDPDGNPLSYRWSAPAGTALSSTTIARPTVTPATPGTYQFTLVVNDGKVDSKPIGVTVTVVQPNRPPVANAGPDQTVDAGVTVQLDGTGSSDPDGNALTYRWSAPAGVALSSTTTPRPAFTPAMSGTYQFTLVVSDGKVDSSPDEVTVAVAPPLPANRPPVANAGPDQTVNIGVTVQLDGSASSDPDGNPLTFRWALSDGPQVGLSNAGTARPGFSPTQAGTYVWTLVVNDGKADSKADLVVITVQEMPAPGKTITEILPGGVSMEFVWIEPGTFLMGSPGSEPGRDADEGPQRQVTISKGFYLAKYEVTQEQWEVAIGSAPWSGQAHVQSNPRHPAVYISWDDVQEYLHRLNVATGDSLYRLPTEAEWEYACRAGTMTRWSFGNDESRLPEHAWYNANAWNVGEPYGHAIGAKLPNPWGLYDMHGNVWEWVQDWYGYYPSNAQTDPTGPVSGSGRVLRGGSVFIHAQNTRSADRNFTGPDDRVDNMGVRLVRLAEPVPANRPPKAHAGPDQTVNLGETVHLDGSGSSDPDGDPLTYRWSAPAGVALSSVTAARPTFAAASVGTYQFTLVVSDGKVDSSPDEVTVAVAQPLPANRPPMANAGPDQMVTVGETVQLDGSASRDPDGNALTYRWTPPAGVRLSDPAAVRPSFTADAEGTYRFGLVVNDGKVVSQPDEVVITATAPVVLPRIVFASDRAGLPAVYSVRLDGSDIANLTGGSSDDREPQASADGRRIVFTSYRDGVVDFYGNQLGELYAVNPDGSDLARLTSNEFADGEGAYSPDGLRIAFTTVRDLDAFGLPQAEVYVMNSDGTNPVNLTRNPAGDGQPAWSPDGRRIAFTTSRDLNGFGLPQMEVYVLNIDGSGLLRLTRSEADDAQPAWSPDGTRIAFVSTRDGNAEVYVMGADGSRQVDVSSNPANDWRPAWSPDGKQIAFVSDRSGTNEVYLMNADGSGVRKLLEGYGNADWPSWLKQ